MNALRNLYLLDLHTAEADELDAVRLVWRTALTIELRERCLSANPTNLVDQRFRPFWHRLPVADLIELAGDLDVPVQRIEKPIEVKVLKKRGRKIPEGRIEAMQAARAAGQSLGMIAETWGMTRQNVCALLKRADNQGH